MDVVAVLYSVMALGRPSEAQTGPSSGRWTLSQCCSVWQAERGRPHCSGRTKAYVCIVYVRTMSRCRLFRLYLLLTLTLCDPCPVVYSPVVRRAPLRGAPRTARVLRISLYHISKGLRLANGPTTTRPRVTLLYE